MAIDTPARRIDYKGRVADPDIYDAVKARVKAVAEVFPLGCEVRHTRSGLTGRVVVDNPENVPGTHLGGRATAWCLTPDGPMVCVTRVDGTDGIAPVTTWVLADQLTPARSRVNRPRPQGR